MLYGDFQRRRGEWRTRELAERSADITSPRPPLNASITDQALRELFDRVSALEAPKAQSDAKATAASTRQFFALPTENK